MVGVAKVGVTGAKLGDDGGCKDVRSRFARLRMLTRRGKSLED